jgi:hypothetical protein
VYLSFFSQLPQSTVSPALAGSAESVDGAVVEVASVGAGPTVTDGEVEHATSASSAPTTKMAERGRMGTEGYVP